MQALKHAENPLGILRIDTDSVVLHGEQPLFRIPLGRDVNSQRFFGSVLDRISDEVLENLLEHHQVTNHRRQRFRADGGTTLFNGGLEICQRLREYVVAVDGAKAALALLSRLPISKQSFE